MTSRSIMAACSAILLATAGLAHGQDMQQQDPGQSPGKARMQENANASAQATSDTAYGGTDDTRGARGTLQPRHCASGPQCNLYFGR